MNGGAYTREGLKLDWKKRPETSCSITDQPKVLYLLVYNQASKHHN